MTFMLRGCLLKAMPISFVRCRCRDSISPSMVVLRRAIVVGVALSGLVQPALATEGYPSAQRPDLPGLGISLPAPLRLPELPPAAPGELTGDVRILVRDVRIEGNTVFSDAELASVIAPYLNRAILAGELLELRDKLTRFYVERGYVNSGAVIPEQRVRDGVVTLRIIEGRLSALEVTGNKDLGWAWFDAQLGLPQDRVLSLATLQSDLRLLLQNPLIARVNAELVPGNKPGGAVLRLAVEEADPWFFDATLDNGRPVSTGSLQAAVEFGHRNLSGRGDVLAMSLGKTNGGDEASARYYLPLKGGRSGFSLGWGRSSAGVVEEPFAALDIGSRSDHVTLGIDHALVREADRHFALGLDLQYRRNQTTLLGLPFSFSPGAVDGRSSVSALRFKQDWSARGLDKALAVRSTVSWGMDAFGASDRGTPDGRFLAWLGQAQWGQRWGGHQMLLRTDVQLSADSLLPLEQMAVGGGQSVRGYRENHLVRDQGMVASVEYRYVPEDLPAPAQGLQLALFADAGTAWNHGEASRKYLASVGAGLRWEADARLRAELYVGHRLKRVVYPGDDLQNHGVHFALSCRLR